MFNNVCAVIFMVFRAGYCLLKVKPFSQTTILPLYMYVSFCNLNNQSSMHQGSRIFSIYYFLNEKLLFFWETKQNFDQNWSWAELKSFKMYVHLILGQQCQKLFVWDLDKIGYSLVWELVSVCIVDYTFYKGIHLWLQETKQSSLQVAFKSSCLK